MTGQLDARELRPLRDLCKEGMIPLCEKQARILAGRGELPAAFVGGKWQSTPDLVNSWIYKKLNKAARRVLA
jgi:hypothetical protein